MNLLILKGLLLLRARWDYLEDWEPGRCRPHHTFPACGLSSKKCGSSGRALVHHVRMAGLAIDDSSSLDDSLSGERSCRSGRGIYSCGMERLSSRSRRQCQR